MTRVRLKRSLAAVAIAVILAGCSSSAATTSGDAAGAADRGVDWRAPPRLYDWAPTFADILGPDLPEAEGMVLTENRQLQSAG